MNLNGKTVLITGGTRRLGLAMAEAVAGRGANVALHYRTSSDEAAEAVRRLEPLGARAAAFRADLLRADAVARLVAETVSEFGRIDVLVNNAAVFERKPFSELTEDDWDRALDTNLKAPFLCARAVGGLMVRQGSGKIVNMACVGGLRPWAGYIPYSVSKAGLLMLTETLALALAPHVQVNAIAPGRIIFAGSSEPSHSSEIGKFSRVPAGSPEDIVKALLYLLDADHVTGETLVVDGGRTLL